MALPRIETLETLPLVDHHCHGLVGRELDRDGFERAMTEADHTAPPGTSFFDSQIGFAMRRWCAPVLGLPVHAGPDEYLARRAELGPDEVATRMLRAAMIDEFCVDTGFAPERLTSSADLATAAGGRAHDVLRLEPVAEQVALDIVTGQVGVAHFPDLVRSRLAARAGREPVIGEHGPDQGQKAAAVRKKKGAAPGEIDVVGVKSVAAYRVGLDLPAERPTDRQVIASVRSWVSQLRAGAPIRLADPVLHSFLIWSGADLGLPVQIHTGYGDTDLHLARSNPLLLTDLLRQLEQTGTPVLLLHTYPFHREAGYLAQVFPHVHLDVGLATHNLGRASTRVLAEALELAPFGKLLFSTDAFALAELYLLGAKLFRRALENFLATGVADGDWTVEDAERVAAMIGSGNARRVYGLAEQPAVTARPAEKAAPARKARTVRARATVRAAGAEPVATAATGEKKQPAAARTKATAAAESATTTSGKRTTTAATAPRATGADDKGGAMKAGTTPKPGTADDTDSTPTATAKAPKARTRVTKILADGAAEPAATAKRRVTTKAAAASAEAEGPAAAPGEAKGRKPAGSGPAAAARPQANPAAHLKEPRGKEHHGSPKPPRAKSHGESARPNKPGAA